MIRIFIKRNFWIFVSFSVLVFSVYSNSLLNAFVSDDRGIVINMPSWTLRAILGSPLSSLRILEYVIIYHFVGFQPMYYRLLNICIHLGSVFLVFIIGKKLLNRNVGILAGSLFAVHPLLVESVTWISGGAYAQYSFFFLLSFTFYVYAHQHRRFVIYSVLAYILSLLSSEKAISLFLVFPLYELAFGSIKKNWKILGVFFGISLLYAGAFLVSGRYQNRITYLTTDAQSNIGFDNPLIHIPISLTSYAFLFLWPDKLSIYQSEQFYTTVSFGFRAFLTLVYTLSIIVSYKKNKRLFFWLCFFLIPLFLTLMPLQIAWIVAERYVYLSTVAMTVVCAYGYKLLMKRQKMYLFSSVVWIFILLLLSVRTYIRNNDWKNEDTLWVATGKTSPSSPNTHNNLGDVYGRHGQHLAAAQEFQEAIRLKPNYADAYHNLGNAYRSLGRIDDAQAQYTKALDYNPILWQSHQNIASILFDKKDFKGALDHIQKALVINPQSPELYTQEGIAYAVLSYRENALKSFDKAIALDPTYGTAVQLRQEFIRENIFQK